MSEALIKVDDLSITYASEEGPVQALRHATLEARAGEAIGIVGESGCGKSTLASALITLLARNARVTSGGVQFGGRDILSISAEEKRKLRGRHIAMIFQDPMTAFNPVLTIGEQLVDYSALSAVTGLVNGIRVRVVGPVPAAGAAWQVLGGTLLEPAITITVYTRPGFGDELKVPIAAAITARVAKLRVGEQLYHDMIDQAAMNVSDGIRRVVVSAPAADPAAGGGDTVLIRAGTITITVVAESA